MEEYYSGLDVLRRLAEEGQLRHCLSTSPAFETLIFQDPQGDWHECWDATEGKVNVTIAMTPERAAAGEFTRPKAAPVTVGDSGTDCATGHCECGACGQPIDPWDNFCRHCGTEVDR